MMDQVDLFLKLLFKHRWDTDWLRQRGKALLFPNFQHASLRSFSADSTYKALHIFACRGFFDDRKDILTNDDLDELHHLGCDVHQVADRVLVLEVPVPDAAPLGPAA